MKALIVLVVCAVAAAWCYGQTPVALPDAPSEVQQFNPHPLPAYLTEAERLLPLPQPQGGLRAPPTGTVYCPAEYEPAAGLLMAWEGYESILSAMIVPITNNDPNATVWVVVDSASEQTTASSYLSGQGANMSRVQFIIRTTDTVWIRDYGPRYIFEDGTRAIIDHTYNRPRPNDDAFNDYLATLWTQPQYDIPLTHGGGNFHLFSNGEAFMTSLILTENPGLTAQNVKDLYLQYQNLDVTIYNGFPTSFDSTQHIDMWMLPVGDYKVVIGQYASSTGQPYTITEGAVTDLTSRGYTVYRTPGSNTSGTHYTYTNGVLLNNQAFISWFNNPAQDAAALATFQAALPGYTIYQIDSRSIIGAAGAMHCIVMHVPAYAPPPEPVAHLLAPLGGELWVIGQSYDVRWTASDDVAVTGVDLLLSTDGGATYPQTIAASLANTGTYLWTVPNLASAQCRVRVVAHDGDGNTGQDDSPADFTISPYGPQVVYDFPLDSNPGWTTTGLWAFGVPTGASAPYGPPDPNSGYTGANVYGYNLSGAYENSLPQRHLTSTALDLTGVTDTKLAFWRRLGVEGPQYDHAYIYILTNGTTWNTVWQNTAEVADSAWTHVEYDISGWADNQPAVQLRWTMGVSDSSWNYCGWNIDDIQVIGVPSAPPPCPGDTNCDGQVDFADINPFVDVLLGVGACCDGSGVNCDISGNGATGFEDINPFVGLLTSNPLPLPCP